jgi:hypothetical protein
MIARFAQTEWHEEQTRMNIRNGKREERIGAARKSSEGLEIILCRGNKLKNRRRRKRNRKEKTRRRQGRGM